MNRLGIIGLGLMGGSLGMALKRADAHYEILGYARRSENRRRALELGAVDATFEKPTDLAAQSDLLVCCLPVMVIAPAIKECIPALREGAVVTDVGSTKTAIEQELSSAMQNVPAEFIGSHPICGSEMQGIESARPDLYKHSVTIITPSATSGPPAVDAVTAMWRAAGSRVIAIDSAEHDRCLARTSHLPHLAASILSAVVARGEGDENLAPFCGTGFRDATRLAEGSPEIWRDIVQSNRAAIARELRVLAEETERVLSLIEAGDIVAVEEFLSKTRQTRRKLLNDGGDES